MYKQKWTGMFGGLTVLLGLLTASVGVSQNNESDLTYSQVGEEIFAIGDDFDVGGNKGLTWASGRKVTVNKPTGGVFALGETIVITTDVAGPVIAAGSEVVVSGAISGSIYAAGETVKLDAQHTGGTILSAGSVLEFTGATSGSVYLYGEAVVVSGEIGGDLYVGGSSLNIAPEALIAGEIVYDASSSADIPEGLNSRGVSLSELREAFGQELGFDHGEGGGGAMDVAGGIGFFIFSLIVGSIVLLILGKQLDHFARWMSVKPVQTVSTGFVGLSAWLGLTIAALMVVFVLSAGLSWFLLILLLVLVPVVMIAGFLLMIVGYFSGMVMLGSLAGRFIPGNALAPFLRRVVLLALALVVVLLIGLLKSGLALLLGSAALVLGLGALGMRIWKGQGLAG